MQFYTNILGFIVGFMLTGWSIWILYNYYRLPSIGKKLKKVQLWLGILILLIGLADLAKAIRDILNY